MSRRASVQARLAHAVADAMAELAELQPQPDPMAWFDELPDTVVAWL